MSAPNAATTKKVRMPSSNAVRAVTKLTPSQISSSPAMAPTSVERVIRRTVRITRAIVITPSRAPVKRQPIPLYPKIASPMAITCLPTGGCTTRPKPGLSSTPWLCSTCQAWGA